MSPIQSRGLTLSKSRSQILRPLSPVLDAVSRLLRPSSAQSYSKTAAWISNDFNIPPSDGVGDALPVPSAPRPPRTPDDRIVPISCSSPSTCGSSTSSVPSNNWTPDAGIIKRRRLRRYVDPTEPPPITYTPEPPPRPEPRNVLEKIVLELFDVQRLDWMMIAEPLQRLYGLDVDSAAVLGILQDNGRIQKTVWWD